MINLSQLFNIVLKSIFRKKIITFKKGRIVDVDLSSSDCKFEIMVYLPSPPSSFYQLSQWIPPLKELNKEFNIVIVTRKMLTFIEVSTNSTFPVIHMERVGELRFFLKSVSPKIILYVNNSIFNNQALLYRDGYHIHLNHGESEKESTNSNQSKAYDYVFVVGQRGIDRYRENLLNFKSSQYLKIGRPQLDHTKSLSIVNDKINILYAPTWEAHYSGMDYCSLEKYGIEIVSEIINDPNFNLIFKPHPLIGTKRRNVARIENKIIKMISKSKNASYYQNIDITNLFRDIDFAFFDNSSVMIDYLHFDKPGAYIEIRKDVRSDKLQKAFYLYNDKKPNTSVSSFINNSIFKDDKKLARLEMKEHYLGNYKKGESTKKFVSTIINLTKKRDIELNRLTRQ